MSGYALSWCRLLFTREAPAYTTGAFVLSLNSEGSPSDSQLDSMETFYDSIQGSAVAQSLHRLICNAHNGSSVSVLQEVIEDAVRHMLKSGLKAALENPKPGNDRQCQIPLERVNLNANHEPAPMEGVEGMNAD